MRAISRFVLRHKGAVVVFWLAVLVAALIAILGRWNWWLPRPAQHLLRVPAPPPPAPRLTADPAHRELGAHQQKRPLPC
jgi:hypothetical protein